MIFDCIENAEKYIAVNEDFKKAFDFIKKATAESYPAGKYEIDGDNVYAMVQEYTTRQEDDCKYEGHRKYIDIQYMIDGIEYIDVVDLNKTKPITEFDAQNDYSFFEKTEKANSCVVCNGDYAILFPHDIHRPGRAYKNEPAPVRKIVVKVKA
ncbi:MAG: YhcH/YjgK/YiaL family protein [Clostridia bacterium]|nr:YhcH/YjgK/YiaL family protein [Clostridia bacterium]